MANSIRSLCSALKGFIKADKDATAGNDVFKGILFDGEYAYASDMKIAIRIPTKAMGFDIHEPQMRTIGGAINEDLDPGDFPDFRALLDNKLFTQNEPTIVTGLQESRTAYHWTRTLKFIERSIRSQLKVVLLEKRGRELIVFSRNSAAEMKTVLSGKLQGGKDIIITVSATYLAAVVGILDYLECTECKITFTGEISNMKIEGYKEKELLCTVILAPICGRTSKYEKLMEFYNRDSKGDYMPALPRPDNTDDLSEDEDEDEEEWDFLGEE